jgi:hypothetical protein
MISRTLKQWAEACPHWGEPDRDYLCVPCARAYAAEQVAQARAEEREACAKIADKWVHSTSCVPSGPCEHIRLATALALAIRARRDEV